MDYESPLHIGECANCGTLDMLSKVQGYEVCFSCECRAGLPFYLREDS